MRPLVVAGISLFAFGLGFVLNSFLGDNTGSPASSSPKVAVENRADSVAEVKAPLETPSSGGDFRDLLDRLDSEPTPALLIEILSIANAMPAPDMEEAFLYMQQNEIDGPSALWAHNAMAMCWTHLDPYNALAFAAEDKPDGKIDYAVLNAVISTWYESDPEACLTAINRLDTENKRKHAKNIYLNSLSEDNPQKALTMLDLDDHQQTYRLQGIFREWARRDPAAALRAANEFTDNQDRVHALRGYFNYLAQENPAQAAQDAMATLDRQELPQVFSTIMQNWARKDLDASLNFLASVDDPTLRRSMLQNSIWSMTQKDPMKIYNWGLQNLDSQSMKTVSTSVINQLAHKDPQEALRFAQDNLSGNDYQNAVSNIAQNWARKDLEQALAFVETIENDQVRGQVITNLTWTISETDPERAFYWVVNNVKGHQLRHSASQIVRKVAETDPQRAATLVEELPYGETYSNAVSNLASAWTQTDPQGAIQWIYSLPEGPERENAFNNFASTYARENPELALQYAQQFPDGNEKNKLIIEVAEAKAQDDPGNAMQWINTIADESTRSRAQYQALRRWGSSDIESALNYLQQNPNIELSESRYRNLARSFAYQDPAVTAEWALSLQGEAQSKAVDVATEQWLRQDTFTASAWIAEMPEGAAKEESLQNLVNAVYRSEPDAAFDWALALKDESDRQRATKRAIGELKKRDANAAWQRVNTSTLPPEEKTALLEFIQE